ncbi:hypothetical protein A9Q86_03830 [Flavobacteriales bacterium 33_180_T64]|nr:hypothetical protein A9Q86_03830 [Flavobacteriales bacterium 33_180_T64]
MTSLKHWFVIINPTSGNGSCKKKWAQIESLLAANDFTFEYAFTEYAKHSVNLVQNVINQGFKKIICVGGDGTLHNIINGIMSQSIVPTSEINVGVIPIGTGNDWVKTHHIPNNIVRAIEIIKRGTIKIQDVGKITLSNNQIPPVFFMNLAGIGFDGYVVSKVGKYKSIGAMAYLFGTLMGLFYFKNFNSEMAINSEVIKTKTLMILVGLCNYSGGGMQLTKSPNPFDGLFDVSIAKDLNKVDIITNVSKLFNGSIVNHPKIDSYKTTEIDVKVASEKHQFIQADGELIGTGNFKVSIIKKGFSFYG